MGENVQLGKCGDLALKHTDYRKPLELGRWSTGAAASAGQCGWGGGRRMWTAPADFLSGRSGPRTFELAVQVVVGFRRYHGPGQLYLLTSAG